jgi:hypothetical protein
MNAQTKIEFAGEKDLLFVAFAFRAAANKLAQEAGSLPPSEVRKAFHSLTARLYDQAARAYRAGNFTTDAQDMVTSANEMRLKRG